MQQLKISRKRLPRYCGWQYYRCQARRPVTSANPGDIPLVDALSERTENWTLDGSRNGHARSKSLE